MASSQSCLYFALFFLFISLTYSNVLSYEALKAGKPTGRSLLQAQKECTVDMEAQNYTILTSQCKGPKYPAKLCCHALLEFCCSFVEELNDRTNNCATTMFSYINLYGQYPPGLFANQCKGGEQGLECDKTLLSHDGSGHISFSSALSLRQTRSRLYSLALVFMLHVLL
ncbi:GPI-anchored protein LLG2-like [Cucurbita maxima]|uniref:GPI-anchored protein LLG2-like n=1 Tax=Cucurbita maxima TaxID=3661 RepID=A0A6J1JN29_CUCMA|nr:GPI-anchored protein LLG2-like [Cucurbita maxima]